jgi:hypothetical protein
MNGENSNECSDLVDRLMNDQRIKDYLEKISESEGRRGLRRKAEQAAEYLKNDHSDKSFELLVTTLERLLPSLRAEKLTVFFSYKAKDKAIAVQISDKLVLWSAGKLKMEHMAAIGVDDVGQKWRERIEKTIPKCDWFLLLLPTLGDERDWVLFEAGYFFRGQGLAGRLVCLHHPDNEVVDALGAHQSVPAEPDKVEAFLEGLLKKPNWIPGMPALNPDLHNLDVKASEIVQLIKPPISPSIKYCCGPHMEVAFDNASAVNGWEQLASGRVISSNDECKSLFGVDVPPTLFGAWLSEAPGFEQNNEMITELSHAVQAIGKGRKTPTIRGTFCVADGRRVQPSICAIRRRRMDQRVEAIDILFHDAALPSVTSTMTPELAALSITLDFSVRFRYQLLEPFASRKLERKDVLAFNQARNSLFMEAMREGRSLVEDPLAVREKVVNLFKGEEKIAIQKMYERSDQLWKKDAEGEMDRAIANLDVDALEGFIQELLGMNQRFLRATSRRFSELLVAS